MKIESSGRCKDCGNEYGTSHHHYRCKKCWEKYKDKILQKREEKRRRKLNRKKRLMREKIKNEHHNR